MLRAISTSTSRAFNLLHSPTVFDLDVGPDATSLILSHPPRLSLLYIGCHGIDIMFSEVHVSFFWSYTVIWFVRNGHPAGEVRRSAAVSPEISLVIDSSRASLIVLSHCCNLVLPMLLLNTPPTRDEQEGEWQRGSRSNSKGHQRRLRYEQVKTRGH